MLELERPTGVFTLFPAQFETYVLVGALSGSCTIDAVGLGLALNSDICPRILIPVGLQLALLNVSCPELSIRICSTLVFKLGSEYDG
eukprot:3217534-Rhodomonas_salina.1